MTPEKAIKKFQEYYDRATKMSFIRNPVAWALYQTWKDADRERPR